MPRGTNATELGSVSFTTNASGSATSQQDYDAWGAVRSGGVSATSLNYTGQRLDSTGLLDYHARLYDPALARFVSADSVVPSSASGGLDGVALKGLTTDFHEPGFVATLNGENALGFWFDLSGEAKRNAGVPWGPANPQALNRYSSVLNAPVKATDPSGHCLWDLCIIEGAAVGAVIVEVVIPAVVGAVVIATAYEAGGALGRAQASQRYESRWQRRETDMGPKDVRRLKDSEVPRQAHAQKRKGNPLRADDSYFVDKEGNLYSGNDKQGELTSEGKLEDYQDE